MISDPFLLCAESVTVVLLGPLSLLTVLCILRSSCYRYPLQAIVCGAHLISDALYLSTAWYANYTHTRPEALYFWFYLIVLNGIWLIVPSSKRSML